jgi:hypothetical protein
MNKDKNNITISPEKANIVIAIAAVVWMTISIVIFVVFWGFNQYIDVIYNNLLSFMGLLYIFTIVAGMLVHELLHALAFLVFGNVSPKHIKFGIVWKVLTPYTHCELPVTALVYRCVLLFPAITLGLIPSILGIVYGKILVLLWGTILLIGSFGDILVFLLIRKIPNNTLIIDDKKEIGCKIIDLKN